MDRRLWVGCCRSVVLDQRPSAEGQLVGDAGQVLCRSWSTVLATHARFAGNTHNRAKSGAGVFDNGTCRWYSRTYNVSSVSSAGSGQARPASRQRRTQSRTVERAQPMATAIWRSPISSARSRSTSRILRTGNLCYATATPSNSKRSARKPKSTRFTHPCRHAPERWPGMDRNPGPARTGIGGRHLAEYAATIGSTSLQTSREDAGTLLKKPLAMLKPSTRGASTP